MPIKRRSGKAAKRLDEYEMEEMLYGMGECLFNGAGYLDGGPVSAHSAEEIAAAREIMQADWVRHHQRVLDAWADRSERDLEIARQYFGDPAEPWALSQFGMPG
jgi:hypothetical protein